MSSLNPALLQMLQQGRAYVDPATGVMYTPEIRGGVQGGDSGDWQLASDAGWYGINPNSQVGDAYNIYSQGGELTGQGTINSTEDTLFDKLVKAGILAGTGLVGGQALGFIGAPGAGAASGGAPAWTSAAADSQLANAALGGDALAGYGAAGATPGAVSIGGTTYGAGAAGAAGAAGSAAGGGGLLGGAGSALGAVGSALGGSGALTGLLGAALGSQEQKNEATVRKDIDPRMAELLYGTGGLLPNIQSTFNQQMGQGGLNDIQRQGLEMQRNFLTSPQYQAGYQQMGNLATGLMGGGVAGNPFKR